MDQAGDIRGFEIDLVRAIGERLGFDLEFVKTPFSQAFVGLAAGKYRLNASNIYIRCERIGGPGRVGHFTVPTFDVSLSISTRAERAERARAMEALAGLSVGVESRGTGADLLADRFKNTVGFRKVVFDNTAALFLALEQGRVDAAIQSDPVARYALRQRRNLIVGPPLPGTAVPVGLLFRDGDPLRVDFNATIDTLKREGVTRRLYERWFGAAPDSRSAVVSVVPEMTIESCGAFSPDSRPRRAPETDSELAFDVQVVWAARHELAAGLFTTCALGALCLAVSIVPAAAVALVREFGPAAAAGALAACVTFVRAMPSMVALVFVFFALPFVGITLEPFPAVAVTLTCVQVAYLSEVFRGALAAVGRGQLDATRALGLGFVATLNSRHRAAKPARRDTRVRVEHRPARSQHDDRLARHASGFARHGARCPGADGQSLAASRRRAGLLGAPASLTWLARRAERQKAPDDTWIASPTSS